MGSEMRMVIRGLARTPAFTAVVVLTLALGIGANTAIFSLFDAVLLRALPVDAPERLVTISDGHYQVFQAFQAARDTFENVLASGGSMRVDVELGPESEKADVALVSGSYFSTLGVPALAGRTFNAADDVPGRDDAGRVAVISYGYWERRFARDPLAVGRNIRVSGTPLTIVGVTPSAFFGERVGAAPDLWAPLSLQPAVWRGRDLIHSPRSSWLTLIGRLRPGVDRTAASAKLTAIYRRILTETFGPSMASDERRDIARATIRLDPAARGVSRLRGPFAMPLRLMMGAVALVLLIACANVASLLLVRVAGRQREIGVRIALGASRERLTRAVLVEGSLLAAGGAAAGMALAILGREALLRLVSGNGARLPLAVHLDSRVLGFACLLSAVTAVLCSVAPAWQSARLDPVRSLGSTRQSAGKRHGLWGGRWLVGAQIAVSVVLLVAAGLFIRSLWNLKSVDLGFPADRVLVADLNANAAGYEGAAYAAYALRLTDRLRTLPGVVGATFSDNGLLNGRDSTTDRMRPRGAAEESDGFPKTRYDVVGPEYFTAVGIPLVAGRDFRRDDDGAAPGVVVINAEMARRWFPERNPLGERVLWGNPRQQQRELEVIGVAQDAKPNGPRDAPQMRFYVPYLQVADRPGNGYFIVRSAASSPAVADLVRHAIRDDDPRVPIESILVGASLADRAVAIDRAIAMLAAAFGILASGLACLGVYGLMAYRVAQKTSEIGVRMALGAGPARIAVMVTLENARLIASGTIIGIPLSMMASRLTRSLLFGLQPNNPATLAGAVGVMLIVGLVAGIASAVRAARVEPVIALEHVE